LSELWLLIWCTTGYGTEGRFSREQSSANELWSSTRVLEMIENAVQETSWNFTFAVLDSFRHCCTRFGMSTTISQSVHASAIARRSKPQPISKVDRCFCFTQLALRHNMMSSRFRAPKRTIAQHVTFPDASGRPDWSP